MASGNFDELTKVLATSTSRRQTIRLLFASVLGSALGFGGIGAAQAAEECGGSPDTDVCGSTNDNFEPWNTIKGCVKLPSTTMCKSPGKTVIVAHASQWVLYQESKDINYTLYAGERVKGIECPNIWLQTDPNYWRFAWDAAKKYLKTDRIGLAINSKATRTRCQLHIHVSCIQKAVRTKLDDYYMHKQIALDPNDWKDHTVSLTYTPKGGTSKTRNFRVLWLDLTTDLLYRGLNLFQLLRYNVVGNDPDMQYQTLVVTPGSAPPGPGGFYILNSVYPGYDPGFGGTGAGEELLDEMCHP